MVDFSKFRRNRAHEDKGIVLWLDDDKGHIISIGTLRLF